MSASFWVSLSTIFFLAIVIFKSYKLIIAYFSEQQNGIKKQLTEAADVYEKAQSLYQDYSKRIESLEEEASKILENAQFEAEKIIKDAQSATAKLVEKKNQELSKRISEYEEQIKSNLVSKYAGIVVDDLYKQVN